MDYPDCGPGRSGRHHYCDHHCVCLQTQKQVSLNWICAVQILEHLCVWCAWMCVCVLWRLADIPHLKVTSLIHWLPSVYLQYIKIFFNHAQVSQLISLHRKKKRDGKKLSMKSTSKNFYYCYWRDTESLIWLKLKLTFDLMTKTTYKNKWQSFHPGAHVVIVNHEGLDQTLPLSENQLTVCKVDGITTTWSSRYCADSS